ncbi:sugar ABC transporter ATP-binding protein [Oceanispirochaeta sp.]|jgi:monosaccharide-transporting ATPase|uniref:sugar ABC transporter ATP-binding protein n=1 Tax=Oceanispirochaeta sp. TaxID=2035350 RepID=UPI002625A165|nr:sugar ABC transporter ATP-binding protein [Oceanispirochaeta sp.]MDA3958633.1 sugar ABC transporter ATP-binding protein [Oceanispirochaeta sp.]
MSDRTPILEMKKIHKVFPGVIALSDVDFRLFTGEVHAVMGQNGAGKSTLVNVLTGVYKQDSGEVLLEGKQIKPDSPLAAQKLGINTVYQVVNLCLNLTVAENIFIGKEPMKFGMINGKEMNRMAQEVLSRLNINIDVTQILSSCSIALQQMVAIARVLDSTARVLILDEPTSSLDESEVEQLFKVIRKLRDEGMAILFITHFLDQTYQISDRITILKDGLFVGEYKTENLPKLELITKMLGKELSEFSYSAKNKSTKDDSSGNENTFYSNENNHLLQVKDLGLQGDIAPFSLELNKGDVLGLAGLLGSGRTEAVRLIFGINTPDQGTIFMDEKKCNIASPKHALMEGIGFCSEDRKNEGIFAELTIRENIIQALQAKQGILNYISIKQQQEIADKLIKSLGIKTPSSNVPVGKLSGGNQQKVLLARWLATNPQVLILDEPTRGIDVGAKLEIMEQILNLSKEGLGVIFISSEFEEIIRCSNKIAVLKDKEMIADLLGEQMTENSIMRTIAGGK